MTPAAELIAKTPLDIVTRRQRRIKVSESKVAQGLEAVTALAIDEPEGAYELALKFIPPASENSGKRWRPEHLTSANIRIAGPGGGMMVESIHYRPHEDPVFVRARTRGPAGTLPGLLSPLYTLRFHDVPNLDPFFSHVDFDLAGGLRETRPAGQLPSEPYPAPFIDYLNKDFASFRQLMLENMTLRDPTWRERNPADLGVVIIEALAYAADYLSYYQDASATEVYLFTARRRTSVRRHARLAGYRVHEGCSARVWVHVAVHNTLTLPRGAQFTTGRTPGVLPGGPPDPDAGPPAEARIFETVEERTLDPRRNGIAIYTWGANESRLPAGACQAALVGNSLNLKRGDTVIFEMADVSREGAIADTGLPGLRHAVRLWSDPLEGEDELLGQPITKIEWFFEDALPFDMEVRLPVDGPVQSAVARGNIVLADMGQTIGPFALPVVPERGTFRPWLAHKGITFAEPYDPERRLHAGATLRQHPERALPCVTLFKFVPGLGHLATSWAPVIDLFSSDGFDRHFGLEVETGGASFLRFGDGELGRRPSKLTQLYASYRIGDGARGNIGADTLGSIFSSSIPFDGAAIRNVRNPLPSEGGTVFEDFYSARLAASSVSERRRRSVTGGDYTSIARRHPEVNSAFVRRQITGSRDIDFLHIQRRDGLPCDAGFASAIEAFMEPTRIVGRTIKVVPPRFVDVRIELEIEVASQVFRSGVRAALQDFFQSGLKASGERGFFHPDNFRFGQPLYLSAVISAAMGIENVQSVRALRFEKREAVWVDCIPEGVIHVERDQIVRVPNNPAASDFGQIGFTLKGGR
jgi:hypothetical protein